MTERVDFYVLQSASPKQRWTCACRVAEKAYLADLKVIILQSDLDEARALDELLWTFNERSFVPHQLCIDERFDAAAPVHLVLESQPAPEADLLVNLTDKMPSALQRYRRVVEIIDMDERRRQLGRERFKTYRDLKITLDTHQLDASADI